MSINLNVPGVDELDDLADAVAREVWASLCSVPELRTLYPGYFISVRTITFNYIAGRVAGPPDHEELSFTGPEELEEFEASLASEIACALDRVLGRVPALPLIARDLPHAIHGVLEHRVVRTQN